MPVEFEVITLKQPYTDINEVLYWLVEQAKAGIPYCKDTFPKFDDPVQVYEYFKHRVTFVQDPGGIELLQHPYTLFENNFHGRSGAGDCDCFVILLLSVLWANSINNNYILLYGNSKRNPSHISLACDFEGQMMYLDLTESRFDTERIYKYRQMVKVFK